MNCREALVTAESPQRRGFLFGALRPRARMPALRDGEHLYHAARDVEGLLRRATSLAFRPVGSRPSSAMCTRFATRASSRPSSSGRFAWNCPTAPEFRSRC